MPLEVGTAVTLSETIQGMVNNKAGVHNIAQDYGPGTIVRIHKHRKGVLPRTSVGNTGPEESSGETYYSFTLTLGNYKFFVPDGVDPSGRQLVPHNNLSKTLNGTPETNALEIRDIAFLLTPFTFIRGNGAGKMDLRKGDAIFIWCNEPESAKTPGRKVNQVHLQSEGQYYFRIAIPQTVPKLWRSNSYHTVSAFTVAPTT